MDRVTWDAVLARLDDALALCHRFGLGKEVAASRFIEYRRVVTGLVTALHDGGQDAAREEFHRDSALSMIALTEAAEFGDVGDFISQSANTASVGRSAVFLMATSCRPTKIPIAT